MKTYFPQKRSDGSMFTYNKRDLNIVWVNPTLNWSFDLWHLLNSTTVCWHWQQFRRHDTNDCRTQNTRINATEMSAFVHLMLDDLKLLKTDTEKVPDLSNLVLIWHNLGWTLTSLVNGIKMSFCLHFYPSTSTASNLF